MSDKASHKNDATCHAFCLKLCHFILAVRSYHFVRPGAGDPGQDDRVGERGRR